MDEFDSDDSFFDDPKPKSRATQAKKKSLEDIFGFQDDKKTEKSGQSSLENVQNSPGTKTKVRFNIEESKSTDTLDPTAGTSKSSLSSKGLDWLGTNDELDLPKTTKPSKTDLLEDILAPNPSKTDSKKSFDLLDDILPSKSQKNDHKRPTSFEDILKESKAQRSGPSSLEKTTPQGGPVSFDDSGKVKSGAKGSSDGLNLILEPSRGGARRGRRGSNVGVTDVLGIFGSEAVTSDSVVEDKKPKKRDVDITDDNIPNWLAGTSASTQKTESLSLSQKTSKSSYEAPDVQESKIPPSPTIHPETNIPMNNPNAKSTVIPPTQSAPVENFQTSISNLQAQESFLLVSLQLKKYEENLFDIKQQQEEILKKQDSQFDKFLNKYIEKQKDIEKEMMGQQERINEHIRMLALGSLKGIKRDSKDEGEEGPSDLKKDEVNSLEKIVQALKQRHNEEYFLMEESYKKQISLLEKSSEQVEHRLNQEIEATSKTYENKLDSLKRQHGEEIHFWTDKIKQIEEKHKGEIEEIKENHSRVLREVRDEFLDQLERFKEQRSREAELFAGGMEMSEKLNLSLEKLGKNEEILENLQGKVVSDYNVLSIAREKSLETKEREIVLMREALEKCREQAEKDRSQLLALVRTLELKISEVNQNSQEERWALQQAAATLAARAAAFDREVEFSRASIERDRKQVKTLKESLLAEQERITMQLTEDKLKLAAEKSRLEVSAKLVNSYEVEKIKTEAETAIQVAKELTEKLNLERTFVQRQKAELEGFRSKMAEKERDVLEREEQLEEMQRRMQQRISEEKRVVQEAKFMENRYKEKLAELQSQAMSLSNREKKLAEEKLLVSRERLALYTSMKSQANHKKCMLCRAEEENASKNDTPCLGYSLATTDPEFIRLKFEAFEDEKNSEVSKEDNT